MIISNRSFATLILLFVLQPAIAQTDNDTEITDDTSVESSSASVENTYNHATTEVETDSAIGVLNRHVTFAKRIHIELGSGQILNEAIFNKNYSSVKISYFTNEDFSVGVGYRGRAGGLTSAALALRDGSDQIQFERAPAPTTSSFISFGYNLFYGKISFSKSLIGTTSTKIDTDFGIQKFGTVNRPFLQTSLNQCFYLTRYLGLGLSIGLSASEITEATSVNLRITEPVPNESSFTSKIQFNEFVNLNLNILL